MLRRWNSKPTSSGAADPRPRAWKWSDAAAVRASTLLLLFLGVWGGVAFADALDGVLEVRSAYVDIDKGVFLLHARVEYPISPGIREALRDGVTLTFDLDTRIERERHFWFNAAIVNLTLRRELAYHAVSDRYVVRDAHNGETESFPTLEEALAYLGKVDSWPIVVESQLDGGSYLVSVRAGVRRGNLPSSLRALLFWTNDWHRESEWYSWSLSV